MRDSTLAEFRIGGRDRLVATLAGLDITSLSRLGFSGSEDGKEATYLAGAAALLIGGAIILLEGDDDEPSEQPPTPPTGE